MRLERRSSCSHQIRSIVRDTAMCSTSTLNDVERETLRPSWSTFIVFYTPETNGTLKRNDFSSIEKIFQDENWPSSFLTRQKNSSDRSMSLHRRNRERFSRDQSEEIHRRKTSLPVVLLGILVSIQWNWQSNKVNRTTDENIRGNDRFSTSISKQSTNEVHREDLLFKDEQVVLQWSDRWLRVDVHRELRHWAEPTDRSMDTSNAYSCNLVSKHSFQSTREDLLGSFGSYNQ